MKVVVAMDSFKGSLSAQQACAVVARALLSVRPDLEVVTKPMADGGEGTARAMIAARGGEWICREVMGPLPHIRAKAGYAWFDNDKTALVEMASASGLELLESAARNPLKTTTYGTGELIRAAVDQDPERILLAVGGSATVDGGVGAAKALGWRFLDGKGEPIGFGGGELHRIQDIILPQTPSLPSVDVLCDVENRLCGANGAARIFGPQKGATPEMVEHLAAGLCHLADVVKTRLGKDIDVPRAGAAGGLAAGILAFMNGRLVSGISTIMKCSGLMEQIDSAQLVVTGEGCFDGQSLQGKVVSGIISAAGGAGVPIAVLAGSVTLQKEEFEARGIVEAIAARKNGMSLDYAMSHSRHLLAEAAAELATKHLLGRCSQ